MPTARTRSTASPGSVDPAARRTLLQSLTYARVDVTDADQVATAVGTAPCAVYSPCPTPSRPSSTCSVCASRTASSSRWNSVHVESVDIVFDKDPGPRGARGPYDRAGALRDILQNHLLQVLALVAMEPPTSTSARDLRDRSVDALRAVSVHDPCSAASSVRACYTAGSVDGPALGAYADEPDVDPAHGNRDLRRALLADVFDAEPTLSIGGYQAEECWRIVDPVLARVGLRSGTTARVPSGTAGPERLPTLPRR